jgi:hypothetical protein
VGNPQQLTLKSSMKAVKRQVKHYVMPDAPRRFMVRGLEKLNLHTSSYRMLKKIGKYNYVGVLYK